MEDEYLVGLADPCTICGADMFRSPFGDDCSNKCGGSRGIKAPPRHKSRISLGQKKNPFKWVRTQFVVWFIQIDTQLIRSITAGGFRMGDAGVYGYHDYFINPREVYTKEWIVCHIPSGIQLISFKEEKEAKILTKKLFTGKCSPSGGTVLLERDWKDTIQDVPF